MITVHKFQVALGNDSLTRNTALRFNNRGPHFGNPRISSFSLSLSLLSLLSMSLSSLSLLLNQGNDRDIVGGKREVRKLVETKIAGKILSI